MNIYQNELYSFDYSSDNDLLRFLWTDKTANMTDDDFKDALNRYAGYAEEYRTKRLLVDLRKFKHTMTDELGVWRDTTITPRYNNAGVQKFAYIVPAGVPAPPPDDAPHGHDHFVTRFFGDPAQAEEWLLQV